MKLVLRQGEDQKLPSFWSW